MIKRKLWKSTCAFTLSAAMIFAPGTASAEICPEDTAECTIAEVSAEMENTSAEAEKTSSADTAAETVIELSDTGVNVDGAAISTDAASAVYAGAEIVYYKEGQDALYGAGDEDDGHSAEEAAAHTVVTITQPGTYRVSGSISKGQIAVDLGDEAEDDANAVVNLILDNADITCTVASGIVVYNAYECGSDDTETASKDVDTSAAGFNLILADDSVNTVNGSHVAKIYKEGTTQEQVDADEAKKQWKFDAAIDSLVSFNIDGEEADNGKLTVNADNEGISSALHMTINGGEVTINSADDAINASEDYVSVLTINDGIITCDSGLGAEGAGIDSNGWIVVNGGYTIACANGSSQDSGVDADNGIYLNGGTVLASGNMYDEMSDESAQPFMVLSFAEKIEEGQLLMLKNSNDEPVAAFSAVNAFTTTVYGSELVTEGDYTLYKVSSVTGDLNGSIYTNITDYQDAVQLQYGSNSMMGMGGFGGGRQMQGQMGSGQMGNGDMPENFDPSQMGNGEAPEMPEGMENGQMPDGMEQGQMPGGRGGQIQQAQSGGTIFSVTGINNSFSMISEVTENTAADETAETEAAETPNMA